jgi:DNA-binding GntR family transcriptional regulator
MSLETVAAAKILCEARNRQKFRELGQNFHENLAQSTNSARNQGLLQLKLLIFFFVTDFDIYIFY